MKRVVLASKSPRRQQLLKEIVDKFDIDVSSSKEKIWWFIPIKKVPIHLAHQGHRGEGTQL